MPVILAEKISDHRNLARYASGTNSEAVNLAHEDLLSAPDRKHRPLGVTNYVCKMYATDFLRVAAMWSPQLITDSIIQDCQKMFPQCNASSRLNIIMILGLLRRTDAIAFLEEAREQNGDDPWITEAATEALEVIRGQREIGLGGLQESWISTHNPEGAK